MKTEYIPFFLPLGCVHPVQGLQSGHDRVEESSGRIIMQTTIRQIVLWLTTIDFVVTMKFLYQNY